LYFGVQFLIGIIYGYYLLKSGKEFEGNDLPINIMGGIVSGIVVYFVYKHLEKKEENNQDNIYNQLDKIGEDVDNNIPKEEVI
jgi:hypothetical protein